MRIDVHKFIATLRHGRVYKRLRESLLPISDDLDLKNIDPYLLALHSDIENGRYFPDVPRGYIVQNKHRGVTRIIPALGYRDLCVYYYCVKELEEAISQGRVGGTFGGWSMGGAVRVLEQLEQEEALADASKEEELDFGPYTFFLSLDPNRWQRQWGEFRKLAWTMSQREGIEHFIKYDIANFFDNINLDLLERKIRARVESTKNDVVDLLFVFLRNWNRQFEGYGPKSVGIPQHEAGDCSRALANFYLQDYDAEISSQAKAVSGVGAYYRYVDDQVLMAQEAADATNLLFTASMELHRIGLNVNSGKVLEFESRDDFQYYWAFDMMNLLDDPEDVESINLAAEMFLERIRQDSESPKPKEWRATQVLNRLISTGLRKLDEPARSEVKRVLFERLPVSVMDSWMMEKYYGNVGSEERKDFIDLLDLWIPTVRFNAFHLNVLKFYGKVLPHKDTDDLVGRIRELRYP